MQAQQSALSAHSLCPVWCPCTYGARGFVTAFRKRIPQVAQVLLRSRLVPCETHLFAQVSSDIVH